MTSTMREYRQYNHTDYNLWQIKATATDKQVQTFEPKTKSKPQGASKSNKMTYHMLSQRKLLLLGSLEYEHPDKIR